PAALAWPIQRKSADDCMPAGLQARQHFPDVSIAITLFDKEMKNRPVVPNVVRILLQSSIPNVGLYPLDILGHRPEMFFSPRNGRSRNVKDVKVSVAQRKQISRQ